MTAAERWLAGRSIVVSWHAAGLAAPPCPFCRAGLDEPCQGRPAAYVHAARLRLMGKWPVEAFHRLPVAGRGQ